jgi:hypothetical protein
MDMRKTGYIHLSEFIYVYLYPLYVLLEARNDHQVLTAYIHTFRSYIISP